MVRHGYEADHLQELLTEPGKMTIAEIHALSPKLCTEPGCGRRVHGRERCDEHEKAVRELPEGIEDEFDC